MKGFLLAAVAFLAVVQSAFSQDTLHFAPKQLIAPALLVGVGAIGTCIDDFQEFDFGLRGDVSGGGGFVAEDVLQYIPALAFYPIKLGGVPSAHNYRDATVILAASYCISAAAAKLVKIAVDVERPNGKDNNSFPSGHSAVAFMGAEFLRMEYKDASPWIGVAGYAVATGTALARIGHGEHWITDVLAGAGIGILGTKVAYWIYPYVQRTLFGNSISSKVGQMCSVMGFPYYDGKGAGIALALQF